MATWSKAHMVFDHLNTEIVGLNPAQGIDVCPCFSCIVLSCVGSGLVKG
jgi:hypothetical protein